MIIGSNCKKAVEPIECIPRQNGGPFAFRTKLGWCVGGLCKKGATEEISCNRIKVIDASTERTASHEFAFRNNVKDISMVEQLRGMYLNDFNETRSEKKALSVEDRKFIDLVKQEGKLVSEYMYTHMVSADHHDHPEFDNEFREVIENAVALLKEQSGYHSHDERPMNSAIQGKEVRDAITKAGKKLFKAPGPDGITNWMLVWGGKDVARALLHLYTGVWAEGTLPET